MIHQFPALQGAPPLLVHILGTGASLTEVAFFDIILGQVGQQLRLGLLNDQVMKFSQPESFGPVYLRKDNQLVRGAACST